MKKSLLVLVFTAVALSAGWPLAAAPPARPLSLKEAIETALQAGGATRVELGRELVRQARLEAALRRAALLPHLEASVTHRDRTENLEGIGLRRAPGFRPPKLVGPFSTFDARGTLTQTLLDFASIRRFQAARAGVRAARFEQEARLDQVAGQVARLYLDALRARARVRAEEAGLELARSLLEEARHRKEAGSGTALEVVRAQVESQRAQQRLLQARLERGQTLLRLARLVGLDLARPLELTGRLALHPVDPPAAGEAVRRALGARRDLAAQRQREEEARLAYAAERARRLPSLRGFVDYGDLGRDPSDALPTRTLGLALRIPLFDGGALEARRARQRSLLHQAQIQTRDLVRQIKLEVRLALGALRLSQNEVEVARARLDLAGEELERVRRRYRAGVSTSLEVVDATTRLERAREGQREALFRHNLARVNLAEAAGTVRSLQW